MAQPGNFTPILLYASSTPGNVPLAANLTNNTTGSEIAINVADKNLFFKDSTNTVNTVPIRQSGTSSNGWLSSTDWNTFNNKAPAGAYLTAVSVVSANGLAGTSSGGTTPALTLSTTVTGILKGNGTAISAATSGTDYAPATSGSSILYGNGAGGFSNVTIGSGVSFSGGTLSATGSGGTVTSVAALTIGTTGTDLSSTVANGTTTPVITLNVPTASATNRGALSSTDWSTFNNKAPGVTFTSGYVPFGQGTTTLNQSVNLFWDNANARLGINTNSPSQALTVVGNSVTTGYANILGACYVGTTLNMNNNQPIYMNSSGGTAYNVLYTYTDDSVYLTAAAPGANLIFRGVGYAETMRIHASKGVSIGNTTDPGASNLSVTGEIYCAKGVGGYPAFSAYKSSNQSISNFTATKITFDTESFDTNSNFASSTFTPTVAGYYQISAGFYPSADSTTFSRAFISVYKNGAEWQRLQDITTIGLYITSLGANGASLVYCNGTTDYIEIYGFIAGTNPVILSGSTLTYFNASLIRGA